MDECGICFIKSELYKLECIQENKDKHGIYKHDHSLCIKCINILAKCNHVFNCPFCRSPIHSITNSNGDKTELYYSIIELQNKALTSGLFR